MFLDKAEYIHFGGSYQKRAENIKGNEVGIGY